MTRLHPPQISLHSLETMFSGSAVFSRAESSMVIFGSKVFIGSLDNWVERTAKWKSREQKDLCFFVHQGLEKQSPLLSAYFIKKAQ